MNPPAWSIGLLLSALFLALTPGTDFGTIDGDMVYWETVALVERGSAVVHLRPESYIPWLIERGFLRPGWDGRWFVRYQLGQPLAASLFYGLGRIVGGAESPTTRLFVNMLPALAMAGTGALLYEWARRLWGVRAALGITALFALATPAPVYARMFFPEALIAFCLLIGFRLLSSGRLTGITLGGLAIGWAVLTREGAVAALPAAGLYLLLQGRTWRQRLSLLGWWGIGLGIPLSLLLWHNTYRFGNPLLHGYQGEGFTSPLLEGVLGLLFSPGRGLLFYAPPVLLALPGAVSLGRRDRALVWAVAALFGGYVALYGQWWAWDGGWSWGPRFLIPVIPFLLLMAGGALRQRPGLWAARGLGALGFLVQLPGIFTDHNAFHSWLLVAGGYPEVPPIWFRPELSPILGQWRLLASGTDWVPALHRLEALGIAPPAAWGLRMGILALGGLGLWGLARGCEPGKPPQAAFRLQTVATGARWGLLAGLIALNAVAAFGWVRAVRQPFCDGQGRRCVGQRFGGQIELVAFSVQANTVRPGDSIGLTLWLRTLRPVTEPLSVYVHVLPADTLDAPQVFQEDHEHPAFWPLPRWIPGRLYSDFYPLRAPDPVPPGVYWIKAGFYRRFPPGGRIPVEGSGADGVLLTEIRVVPAAGPPIASDEVFRGSPARPDFPVFRKDYPQLRSMR
ncbi:ArnT family glycosyltransferase [Thermoflexus sp.]|uniref:ArnT family glycosyltransferase n=1 Tax=Thermoflexus sp. TaxID=1969742 RepID=UPI0035E40926